VAWSVRYWREQDPKKKNRLVLKREKKTQTDITPKRIRKPGAGLRGEKRPITDLE